MKKLILILAVSILSFVSLNTVSAAISFVSSTSGGIDGGGDVTLSFSSFGLLQNDLVIVSYGIGDNDDVDFNMAMVSAGWTEVADLFSNDIFDASLGTYWKIMGATPDTSAIVDGQGGADASVAATAIAFRGVDKSFPMDVTPVTSTGLNTFNPNPPSIDHNNISGIWAVITGAARHNLNAGTFTNPTNYTTNGISLVANDTTDITTGMGYRSSGVLDPEDPGVMTHSGVDSVDFSWGAGTIALRPARVSTIAFSTSTANASAAAATSLTFSFTTTGENRMLFVPVLITSASDLVTGVTYNAVAMTRVNTSQNAANATRLYLYALPNPTSGANNVVVSTSASTDIHGRGFSYTGVKNAQPEVTAEANNSNSATISQSLTTIADNAWVVAIRRNSLGTGTAGVGTSERSSGAEHDIYESSFNPNTPAGLVTINAIDGGVDVAWSNLLILASIAPATADTVTRKIKGAGISR